mmetsp:Transcript_9461/g.18238  ORF Transcript_9461/g.18238 Transcript_9461/m.18238 type:complete len:283 (-) Transcript_9461:712-1560(-)|eukprot:CAMPEP_0204896528 /NCGR_PEP_ID=MMETSP1397-20131031/216_1 /ASSEMBLY_ACC=CAM_ASM_000891 /TAXON_ID=49980 /ORGANISM="Climacostomum Climacostomum virens, Strain Stock W-24" /LENGTH=282 /DNA_ID=CAMNT_0052064149 /DNA_START=122 /DNA_END=970 /DNA_ORIENTATION=-
MSVFVGNLPLTAKIDDLREDFKRIGDCKINYFGGFAFVEYEDIRAAKEAVDLYDGYVVHGSPIRVELTSRYQPPASPLYKLERNRTRSRSPARHNIYSIERNADESSQEAQDTIEAIKKEAGPKGYSELSQASSEPEMQPQETHIVYTEISEPGSSEASESSENEQSEEADQVPLLTPARKRKNSSDADSVSLRSSRRAVRRPQRYSPESSAKGNRKTSYTKVSSESSEPDHIFAEDGTVFDVTEELEDGLKVQCSLCKIEIKSQSIGSHLKSKAHQKNLAA